MITFGIKDFIDILLVAFIIYQTYLLIKGTNAVNIFIGIISFVVCWYIISFVLNMRLLGAILDKVMSVGAIALIIIFKEEIRRFFSIVGSKRNLKILKWIRGKTKKSSSINEFVANEIANACQIMSSEKCGALIIIKQNADLTNYVQTGEIIKSYITTRLIRNIFFKNSPLHDGAIIIDDDKILAVSCILPISQNPNLPHHFGLRHRAAIGVTEKTDALAIIVSEENGKMSIAQNGIINYNISKEYIIQAITNIAINK